MGTWPDGALRLYETSTRQPCVRAGIGSDCQLKWEPPDTLVLTSPDHIRRARPCDPFIQGSESAPRHPLPISGTTSKDGALLAETRLDSTDSGILRLRTILMDRARQSEIARVDWSIDECLGDLGLGGEWVGPSTFLLYETLDRGPLLLEASGEVTALLPEILGLAAVPSITGPEGYGWMARPALDPSRAGFHLLLSGVGNEEAFPLAHLYHRENGRLEMLPYQHPWRGGFSPDGQWLLMDARPDDQGYEAHQVWIRPVDAIGGEWALLAERADADLWSPICPAMPSSMARVSPGGRSLRARFSGNGMRHPTPPTRRRSRQTDVG